MKAPAQFAKGEAPFLGDPSLLAVMTAIEHAGGEVRVNGGAVRNALLREPVADIDLSTTLNPAQTTEALQRADIKAVPTGFEHGTVTAVHGGKGYEITSLREDIETDGRRALVRFGSDWTADASRRDFTLNALYCDRHGRIFDPLDGYGDLVNRRIRFIGDADRRIAEDRLRILRFFRFFAWYGSGRPDAESLKACNRARDGLDGLSAERVWHELYKLLSAPDPVKAVLWMRTAGVLTRILPETEKWGTDLLPRLGAMERQLAMRVDPLLRLMAMLPPRAETVEGLGQRLKISNTDRARLANWVGASLPPTGMADPQLSQLLYRSDRQAIHDRLALERARMQDVAADAEKCLVLEATMAKVQAWSRPVFPLKGADLLAEGLQPGPNLGKLLARLETEWLESGFSLSRAELVQSAIASG